MRNYIYVCKFKSRIYSVVIIKIIIRKGTAFEELADARNRLQICGRLYMAEIFPIRCKTLSNQSINQSINQIWIGDRSLDWLTVYHAGYKFILRCKGFVTQRYQQMKNFH